MPAVGGFIMGAMGLGGGLAFGAAGGAMFGGWVAGAAFGSTMLGAISVKLLTSVALSALSTALMGKPEGQQAGMRTSSMMTGGTNPEAITLGAFATSGALVCPPMSHGSAGKTPNAYLTYVIELAGAPRHDLLDLMLDGEYVEILSTSPHTRYGHRIGGRFQDRAWIKYHDGTQTTADAGLLATYPAPHVRPWTANMVGTGICYAILTFQYDREVFHGWPSARFVISGMPLYDPRRDSTAGGSGPQRWDDPVTHAPTLNPAVMIYNILRGIRLPGDHVWGGEATDEDLPYAVWAAAMDVCDQQVSDGDGGTEPQYRAGIEVFAEDEPFAVIDELLSACAGHLTEHGGVWNLRCGAPGMPVLFVSDDDIIITESQEFDPFPAPDATYNAITASYPDPESLWESRDAEPIYNEDWEAEDGGRRLPVDLPLTAVPWGAQVTRIMSALIRDHRRMRRHIITLPPEAGVLEPGDVVSWTSEANFYSAKLFEVAETVRDPRTGLVQVSLREIDPEDYDPPSNLTHPAPPDLRPVRPAPQAVPGWAVSSHVVEDADGDARRSAIRASWDPEAADDARGVRVQVRRSGDAASTIELPLSDVAAGEATFDTAIPGEVYQARGRIAAGRRTVWTDWSSAIAPNVKVGAKDIDDTVYDQIEEIAQQAGVKTVWSLPAAGDFANQIVMLLPDGQLYRWDATLGEWSTSIYAGIPDGAIDTAKFAQGIEPVTLADDGQPLPTTKSTETVFWQGKLYRWNGSAYTASVPTVDLLGQITGAQVADNAITSAKLANNAVTRDKIVNDAINSAKLADGAATSTKIATGAITQTKIEDGAISTPKLAAGAVTAGKIEAGAVTAGKIAADAVQAGNIAAGAVTAGTVQAGAIGADEIAAGAVLASKLVVTDLSGNMLPDRPWSQGDFAGWGVTGGGIEIVKKGSNQWNEATSMPSAWAVRFQHGHADGPYMMSDTLQVQTGQEYSLSVRLATGGSPRSRTVQLGLRWYDENDTLIVGDYLSSPVVSANSYGEPFVLAKEAPAGAVWVRAWIRSWGDRAEDSGVLYVAAAEMTRKRSGAALITPYSITTEEIAANAVTAGKIDTDAVTAGKIAAGAVNAREIAAGAITASKMAITSLDNLVLNPWSTASSDGWQSSSTDFSVVPITGGGVAGFGARVRNTTNHWITCQNVPVKPGERYHLSVNCNGNSAGNTLLQVRWTDSAGNHTYETVASNAQTGWRSLEGITGPAPDNVSFIRIWLVRNTTNSTNTVWWAKPVLRRAASGELIVDGAITANKIAAGAVTADSIAANAVIASKIAAGTITGSKLAMGSVLADISEFDQAFINDAHILGLLSARHIDMSGLNTGFKVNKQSLEDDSSGLFFGTGSSLNEFGFYLSRYSPTGSPQSLKVSDKGVSLLNAQHYLIGGEFTPHHMVTESQTINLPNGTQILNITLVGAGGGGSGHDGTRQAAGHDGGPTTVVLMDGTTQVHQWIAAGGLGGDNIAGIGAEGRDGEDSILGRGGRANLPGDNGVATGVRGGGGRSVSYKGGGAGRGVRVEEYDISGLSNPRLIITIGAGGAGGSARGGSARGFAGGNGAVEYRTALETTTRADVLPLVPTATGSFSKPSSATGANVFPALGPGMWNIFTTNGSNLDIGQVRITSRGHEVNLWLGSVATFIADQRPNILTGIGQHRTIHFNFYRMGNWG